MRIFIVHPSEILTDSRAHGDGLLAYRYICELAARGHELSVACEIVELENPAPPNVRIYPIALRLERFGLARRIEYAVKMRRLFATLDRTERFDIAHQLNPVYAGLSLGLAGASVPLVLGPYVAHWTEARSFLPKKIVLDAIAAVQQRAADAILVSGPSALSRIVGRRSSASKILTVPYGIDLEMFPEQPFPLGDPVILYLAALAERKGILVLLAAFDRVAARVPAARLVVAGGGAEQQHVMNVARQSPFWDRITFLGKVPRADVPRTFGDCSVYCLASFGEPYGMSLVEAMASGRPVVATNVGGPRDLIDAQGGVLVAPGDVAALAAALETIVLDPQAGRAMGAHNRQVIGGYAWPAVIDRLEAVYERVVHRGRRKRSEAAASMRR